MKEREIVNGGPEKGLGGGIGDANLAQAVDLGGLAHGPPKPAYFDDIFASHSLTILASLSSTRIWIGTDLRHRSLVDGPSSNDDDDEDGQMERAAKRTWSRSLNWRGSNGASTSGLMSNSSNPSATNSTDSIDDASFRA